MRLLKSYLASSSSDPSDICTNALYTCRKWVFFLIVTRVEAHRHCEPLQAVSSLEHGYYMDKKIPGIKHRFWFFRSSVNSLFSAILKILKAHSCTIYTADHPLPWRGQLYSCVIPHSLNYCNSNSDWKNVKSLNKIFNCLFTTKAMTWQIEDYDLHFPTKFGYSKYTVTCKTRSLVSKAQYLHHTSTAKKITNQQTEKHLHEFTGTARS